MTGRARDLFVRSLDGRRATGDRQGLAVALPRLGGAALYGGDPAEALAIYRAVADRRSILHSLHTIAAATLDRHGPVAVRAALAEGLMLSHDLCDKRLLAHLLDAQAVLAIASGWCEGVCPSVEAVAAFRDGRGDLRSPAYRPRSDSHLRTARVAIRGAALAAAISPGRSLSLEQAVEDAIAHTLPIEPAVERDTDAVAAEPSPLTPREAEMLTLIVPGRSNPEIAAALFISRRTLTSHVSRIVAQTGVETRGAAVARAYRSGLA